VSPGLPSPFVGEGAPKGAPNAHIEFGWDEGYSCLRLSRSSAEDRIPLTLTNLLNAKLVCPSPTRGEGRAGARGSFVTGR
jgi:hypothetical protein